MDPRWWLGSLLALAGAVYFAITVRDAIRSGEVARFFGGSLFTGMIIDLMADSLPSVRSLKYISREENPIRFRIAIVIRSLLAIIAGLLAIGFFVASFT
jgi:hypothetical protein